MSKKGWKMESYYECFRLLTLAQEPAAGADLSYRFPAGAEYRLLSAFLTLTTSNQAANRIMAAALKVKGQIVWQRTSLTQTPASQTLTLCIYPGADYQQTQNLTVFPFPTEMRIVQEAQLVTSITAIQTGDLITGIGLYLEVYPIRVE